MFTFFFKIHLRGRGGGGFAAGRGRFRVAAGGNICVACGHPNCDLRRVLKATNVPEEQNTDYDMRQIFEKYGRVEQIRCFKSTATANITFAQHAEAFAAFTATQNVRIFLFVGRIVSPLALI